MSFSSCILYCLMYKATNYFAISAQRISKSVQATRDFSKLMRLSTDPKSLAAICTPPSLAASRLTTLVSPIPSGQMSPSLPISTSRSKMVRALPSSVASGSGNQPLWPCSSACTSGRGFISIGPWELSHTNAQHLRNHVAVVSQHPNLFDASITENIAYGARGLPADDVQRAPLLRTYMNSSCHCPRATILPWARTHADFGRTGTAAADCARAGATIAYPDLGRVHIKRWMARIKRWLWRR